MENFSPSRIQPVTQEQEKNQNDARPQKQPKPRVILRNHQQTPAVDVGNEEEHQLDERA